MKKQLVILTFGLIFILILIYYSINNIFTYNIVGYSMYPTLTPGEKVLGIKKSEYTHGDIICYKRDDKNTIKRIIAIPGDTIDIKEDGTIILNGEELEETYIENKTIKELELSFPMTIPQNEYFVLGDNREESYDSRYIKIGNIKEEEIESKIIFVLMYISQ